MKDRTEGKNHPIDLRELMMSHFFESTTKSRQGTLKNIL